MAIKLLLNISELKKDCLNHNVWLIYLRDKCLLHFSKTILDLLTQKIFNYFIDNELFEKILLLFILNIKKPSKVVE